MTLPEFHNSAVVRIPERLLLASGSWRRISVGVRYGLIDHPRHGPILIDTGYSPRATQGHERSLMLKLYGAILRPELIPATSPISILARKGFTPDDVRLVIVTHFHPDHIAALRDFPNARFIASGTAWQAITAMSAVHRIRHGIFLELLPNDFAARLIPLENHPVATLPLNLGQGWDLLADGTCLALDLSGHGLGHFGLVWPQQPLLYAVDTQWLGDALMQHRLPSGPARLVYADETAMRASAEKVRRFAEMGGQVLLCHERVSP